MVLAVLCVDHDVVGSLRGDFVSWPPAGVHDGLRLGKVGAIFPPSDWPPWGEFPLHVTEQTNIRRAQVQARDVARKKFAAVPSTALSGKSRPVFCFRWLIGGRILALHSPTAVTSRCTALAPRLIREIVPKVVPSMLRLGTGRSIIREHDFFFPYSPPPFLTRPFPRCQEK